MHIGPIDIDPADTLPGDYLPFEDLLAVFGLIPVHLGRPPVWATWAGPICAGPREISQSLGRSGIVNVFGPVRSKV
jgi:hypothetical protein